MKLLGCFLCVVSVPANMISGSKTFSSLMPLLHWVFLRACTRLCCGPLKETEQGVAPYLCSNNIRRPQRIDFICTCIFCSITICLVNFTKTCDQEFTGIDVCIFFMISIKFFTPPLDNVSSLIRSKKKSMKLEKSFGQMVLYPKG